MDNMGHLFRGIAFLCALFFIIFFPGCVRFSGGAGYWHTDSKGEAKGRQVGFDTADYIPGSPAPGSITTS